MHPYTAGYIEVIGDHAREIAETLEKHIRFTNLVAAQERCDKLYTDILETERNKTQIEKVLRYKRLAMIEYYFKRYASDNERAEYESLLMCENGPFFDGQARQTQ